MSENTEGLDLPQNNGTQINTKVDDDVRDKIDKLIYAGLYRSRSEVVRRAVSVGIECIMEASVEELKQREELVRVREAYENEVRELQKKYGFVK